MLAQSKFSYEKFWELQEPQKKPHKQIADDYGLIDEDDFPVAPTLKIIRKYRDIVEDMPEDELVAWSEMQKQVILKDIEPLLAIPYVQNHFIDLRQMEDGADVSVFNTEDFLQHKPEFDKKRYAYNKIAERAEDLALLHSCVSNEEGKKHIRKRFEALVNSAYRNRALYLANVKYPTASMEKQAEIRQTMAELNKQIIRLRLIWKKFAYSS